MSPVQRSEVLEHIWKQDDIWPTPLCQAFILQWTSMLESKVLLRGLHRTQKQKNCTEYFFCTWGYLSVMLRCVCAEEAHADRWLARAG